MLKMRTVFPFPKPISLLFSPHYVDQSAIQVYNLRSTGDSVHLTQATKSLLILLVVASQHPHTQPACLSTLRLDPILLDGLRLDICHTTPVLRKRSVLFWSTCSTRGLRTVLPNSTSCRT